MDFTSELQTEHLIICLLNPSYLDLVLKYQDDNRTHLAPWEPKRGTSYYGEDTTLNRLVQHAKDYEEGKSISLIGLNQDRSRIIGICHFTNITHGVFQACNLGYSINEKDQGRGLMFEMLEISIQTIFAKYKLHRIMANFMPSNIRSGNLLTRLGFQKEGMALSYLKIDGLWKDHILTSKINVNNGVIMNNDL